MLNTRHYVFFVGGAGDKKALWGYGPTHVLGAECARFKERLGDEVAVGYFDFREADGIMSLIKAYNRLDEPPSLHVVAHSYGAATMTNLIHDASAADNCLRIGIYIALDPVGVGKMGMPCRSPLKNVDRHIVINAARGQEDWDISEMAALMGGRWGKKAECLTDCFYDVDTTHREINTMLHAPLQRHGGLTPLECLYQTVSQDN